MTRPPAGVFFRNPVSSSHVIAHIKALVGLSLLEGPSDLELEGTCDSRCGGHKQLVFTTCEHYSNRLSLTESLVLIDEIPDKLIRGSNQFCMLCDPRAIFIDVLTWLIETVGVDAHHRGFTNEATISVNAQVSSAAIVEHGVEIGSGSVISAGAVVKTGTRIGKNTFIRENAVIGSDGVTVYRTADDRLLKFPHLGGVFIGSNTEIGVSTVVAGGILAPTIVDSDVIIGSLCNIGHGSKVGRLVWMSVGSLLGGHTTVNTGATIAMGCCIRDNLVIGEKASLGMGSVVVKDVEATHAVFGNPAKRMPRLKTGPSR